MTNSAQFSQVTDELLSAYLDQVVTPDEKSLVEAAVAADPMIAWRLQTLRQTVQLLHTLPAVALPRSFVLTEAQLTAAPPRELISARGAATLAEGQQYTESTPSSWQVWMERWRSFWQPGSPVLRNAMAASFALLLVLVMGDRFLATRVGNLPTASTGPSVTLQTAAEELPTAELVALQQAAPASQATSPEAAAVVSAAAATANGAQASVANAPPLAEASLRTTAEEGAAIRASGPPGEDPGVTLAPAGEAVGATAASGVGGGQEGAFTGTSPQSDQPTAKADMAATSDVVTAAAFDSPLSGPEQTVALATVITSTTALTVEDTAKPMATAAAISSATSSNSTALTRAVVITTTSSDPLSTTVVTAAQPPPPSQAVEPQPGATASAGRIRLLQMVSALVTLLLAGLWWRSR